MASVIAIFETPPGGKLSNGCAHAPHFRLMRALVHFLALVAIVGTCSSPEAPTDPPVPLDDTPGGWKMIAAGDGQTCGLSKTNFLYCWGKNDRGQLGDGTKLPHSTPMRILSDSVFAMVTAGTLSSCGVTSSGVGYCWGWVNDHAQSTPVITDSQRRFTTLRAGTWMICGLTTLGSVYCWSLTVIDAAEALLPGGVHFQALVNSNNFFCGISTDAKTHCWSADESGRPTAAELQATSPAAVKVAAGDFGYYTPGRTHLCTIDNRDSTYCWGSNVEGQLGLGDRDDRTTPTLLVSHKFAEISASGGRTCGVAVNGIPYCWGRRTETGAIATSDTAEALLPGMRAAAVSVGPDHYCFLTTGGAAFCGGNNGAGQLGTGTSGDVNQPLRRVLDPQ
jgi:alpha-tubulin suppressor-like RCC1 family protein